MTHRPYQRSALPDAPKAQGKALMCCAVPTGDVVISLEASGSPVSHAPKLHTGVVAAMNLLADEVMQVLVRLPEGKDLPFTAGQYINIVLADGQRRAFSFANPPQQREFIELHVRRIPGGRFTGHVFDGMKPGDTLDFDGPLGSFTLKDSERPILFVAGATGFAPVKSIVQDAFARGLARTMHLYWGVRERKDLYQLQLVQQWAREHGNFKVTPVLSQAQPQDEWTGRTGLVHEAMLADHADLTGFEVYVCGSVQMVETAVPNFLAHGLSEGACFTDAFLPSHAT